MRPGPDLQPRYASAAPLVERAPAWVAIGCGDGAGAATITAPPSRVLLVDADATALRAAARAVPAGTPLAADLAEPGGIETLRGALADYDGAAVTCFGVLDRLSAVVPLLDLLGELVETRGMTVVLDVPAAAPDAAGDADRVVWGDAAFEELRRLLPGDPVVAHEVALAGAAIVPAGQDGLTLPVQDVRVADVPPTAYLVAFGPHAADLVAATGIAAADRRAESRRVRELEAAVRYLEARLAEHGGVR